MDPQQGPPQPDLLIGQTIGNYLVTQKLGEGGMGSVYLAEHPTIGKKVALKVLHSEFSNNPDVANRFFQEAKAVNDIGHPNIVDVVDFGIIQSGNGREQLVYFIMEYLAGATLSHLIRTEAPLPPERALTIALQVADALSASHRCKIVHRDLKPDNIILLQRGRERDFVKLLDFGIAKLTGGGSMSSHRTRTGIVMGTPAYMSPEQCEGRDTVDERTDIYALGIVLYEMLTGRVPFLGDGYGEILVQHLTQRPTPPSQFRMLPPHVEVLVMKALEKRAEMRYPTMEEFMRAISDPVGYVEAHGGVTGFLQRQLMPSNAPISSVRLGPTPLTPAPGTLTAPGLISSAPTAPGVTSPVPTTLGSATGQVQATGGKSGYILAGLLVVAAAVAGIIVLVGKDDVTPAGTHDTTSDVTIASGSDPGSARAAGSAGSAASDTAPLAGSAGSDTAPVAGSTGSGDGSAVAAGSGSGAVPGEAAGSGSDAGSGSSAGSGGSVATIETVEIEVVSSPPGAKILIDGAETGKLTPATLSIPRKPGKTLAISLRLKGYATYTFKAVDASESSQQKIELVKAKAGGTAPAVHPTGRNPGAGTKNGSGAQGASDSDLMRPD